MVLKSTQVVPLTDVKSFQRQSIAAILEERPLFEEDEQIAKAVGHLRESGNYEVFLAQGRHYSSVTVRDLMYASDPANTKLGALAYLVPDMPRDGTIADAARLMYDHRLRALPISVEPAAFAAASVWGILKQMNGSLDLPIEASEIMTQNPVTSDTEDTVSKARSIMTNRSFDHLPVTKGGRLTGILTSSDVLFHLMSEERAPLRGDAQVRFDYPVERIAQDFVFEVEPTAAASKVVSLMVEKKTSSVLVARGEELRGIITPRDVMKPILGPKEKRLRYYIVGLPSEPFEAEVAKGKFERLSSILTKAFPYIEEIRAVIKTKQISDQRARYEVNVDIYTPKERFAYSETGYDLAVVFESLGFKMKKLLSSKQSKATRTHGDGRWKTNRQSPEP